MNQNLNLNINYLQNIENNIYENGELNVLCLNIRSLRNKFELFNNFIDSKNFLIHVIVLTEVWIYSNENEFYNISNYNMYTCNRDNNRSGGVIVYVHTSINSNKINFNSYENNEFVLVELTDFKIQILGLYKQPSSDITAFVEYLESFLSKNKNYFILGDFNINLLNGLSDSVTNYKNMIDSNGAVILNSINEQFATRKSNTVNTIIDHIVTDLLVPSYTFLVSETDLSDHCFLLLNIDFKNPNNYIYDTKTVVRYENIIKNNLIAEPLFSEMNNLNELSSYLTDCIEKNTKEIKIKVTQKSQRPWITKKNLETIKIKDFFYNLHKKFPQNTIFKSKYEYYKNMVIKTIRNSKRTYFKNETQNCKNSNKKLWEIMNEIGLGKNKRKTGVSLITINNKDITDELTISNSFNEYFINISKENLTNSNLNQVNINQSGNIIKHPFILENTNSEEVEKVINELNSKSATGPDKISVKFIKRFLPNLILTLCILINKMFSEGYFASCLKPAIVTPIFKKFCKKMLSNYRPISVLNALSKLVERLLYSRLVNFLKINSVINENQFGFVEKSSTVSSAMQLLNLIRSKLDQGQFVSSLFIDLSKAFDMVNHNLLINKLKKIGITDTKSIELFQSYLTGRSQSVKINNTIGSELDVLCGVPQGSILGPLFFIIFINDIFKLKLSGKLQLYADDMVLVYSDSSLKEVFSNMSNDIKIINNWLNDNLLSMNLDKTNYILFKVRNKFKNENLANYTLKLNDHIIQSVEHAKFLGLIIDDQLSWKFHINSIKSKINSATFALKRLSHILPDRAKMYFFNSCILSHLTYLNPIWNVASNNVLNSLKVCMNRSVKSLKRLPYLYPSELLYSEEILPLDVFNKFHSILLIYKIKNNLIKHNFTLNVNINNTRQQNLITTNYCRTNIGQKDLLYIGISLFNQIPFNITNDPKISTFKKNVKKYLYNNRL